jgi:hypothetical protein
MMADARGRFRDPAGCDPTFRKLRTALSSGWCIRDIDDDLRADERRSKPSPVTELIPFEGEAATTSWPLSRRFFTTLVPMSPVPPMTTIFMLFS